MCAQLKPLKQEPCTDVHEYMFGVTFPIHINYTDLLLVSCTHAVIHHQTSSSMSGHFRKILERTQNCGRLIISCMTKFEEFPAPLKH